MYEPRSRRSASVTWHVLIKYLSDMWSTPQEDKACTHEMQKNKLGCSKKPWTEIRTAPFYLSRYKRRRSICVNTVSKNGKTGHSK